MSNSSRYGFPLIYLGEQEADKLLMDNAALLLLDVSAVWSGIELMDGFNIKQGTSLYEDTKKVIEVTVVNSRELEHRQRKASA
ncbi:hypothetical protein BIY20_17105 [Vibrio panuliri]|uniref:Uncharacterized protein n=2 Tax=Vibrio panuliri TaxID=1381081 RepID=A0ABX3F471_9VIBR|nr:hypothetical protein BIY20_17105 [Vibrio panuliri]